MLRHRERMEENGIAPLTWEGKRSAAAVPDPEVVDKPLRRRFAPSYKLRIVEEADRCTEPGEVGRLLRREGLYSSHLTTWRKAARSGSLKALSKKRGRKRERNPLEEKVRKLERENTRLEKELHKAHLIIDVQGKVGELYPIVTTAPGAMGPVSCLGPERISNPRACAAGGKKRRGSRGLNLSPAEAGIP